jgi:hypothetical protein
MPADAEPSPNWFVVVEPKARRLSLDPGYSKEGLRALWRDADRHTFPQADGDIVRPRPMTPLHAIVTRMKRLPLRHQAAHLKALIDAEKPRSIRRKRAGGYAKDVNLRRLKSEKRNAA